MVCCLLCFDDSPIDGDPRAGYQRQWQIGMMDAPTKNFGNFCFSFCCPHCAQYFLREKALEGDWTRYKCCQGYFDACCFKAGSVGDEGNQCCMVLEACCCLSCAVSASRMLVMDSRNIMPDPCDNRIIRFNNCIQLLSCICDIVACFVPEMRDLANLIDFIADCVFLTTQACMTAQTDFEMNWEKQNNQQVNWGGYYPQSKDWNKNGGGGGGGGGAVMAPQGQAMARPVVAQAQPRMFQVQCPQGVGPGQQIIVTTPEGVQMGVQVPQGVAPGQVFQVNY